MCVVCASVCGVCCCVQCVVVRSVQCVVVGSEVLGVQPNNTTAHPTEQQSNGLPDQSAASEIYFG